MWIPQMRKVRVVWWLGDWWMRWRQTTNFHFSHCLANATFIILQGDYDTPWGLSSLPSFLPFSFFLPSFLLLLFLSFTLSTSGILTNFTQSLSSFLTLIFSSLIISDFNYISEILAINKGTELITHRYLLSIEFILLTLG